MATKQNNSPQIQYLCNGDETQKSWKPLLNTIFALRGSSEWFAQLEFIPFISAALPFYFIGENQPSSPGTFSIAIRKNVSQHILAPSAVACDILHLRASAHLRHAVPFIS